MPNKFPGKKCHKKKADMIDEEYIQHRIYMRAQNNEYNKRQRAKFVGPINLTTRFKQLVGPPKPVWRGRKRSAEYERIKSQRIRDGLKDKYIRKCLFKMIPNLKFSDITSEIIEVKRQQLKLWRMANA
jgi:hypothetical protein